MTNPDQTPVAIPGEALTTLVMGRLRANYVSLVPMAQAIADYCGVKLIVVGGWFVDPKTKPLGGVSTLKLWYLLQQCGIPSPELDQVTVGQPLGAYIGKLLAYNVLEMKDAQRLCGGAQDNVVLNAARGSTFSVYSKLDKSEIYATDADGRADLAAMRHALEERYGEELAEKVAAVDAIIAQHDQTNRTEATKPSSDKPEVFSEAAVERIVHKLLVADSERKITQRGKPSPFDLVMQIIVARVAAQYALGLPAEELALVRRLLGDDAFNLRNLLASLSGARAAKLVSEG